MEALIQAISYKVETNEQENYGLEQIIDEKSMELHVDGELVRNLIIGPYRSNSAGTMIEGILKVEGTKELPDAISVGLSFTEFAGGRDFLFDMEKFAQQDDLIQTKRK